MNDRIEQARDLVRQALALLDEASTSAAPVATAYENGALTERICMEIISHEAIVQEWYKDSAGVGTWSVGLTNASGHNVDRYKDNPQTIQRCLEVFIWALREQYVPDVQEVFEGRGLEEHEFAAALSFHYNTGAIGRADWVKHWLAGDESMARRAFMNWRKPPEIIPRREAERALFFNAEWSSDGTALVWPVAKPSYTPDWDHPKRIDIRDDLRKALAA